MELINKSIKCHQCGAPMRPSCTRCQYCGTEYGYTTGETPKKRRKMLKDFGWSGLAPFILNIAGILILYTIGWILEDKQYWLDDQAIIFWAVALPLWILVMTFIWSQRRWSITFGLILSLMIFGIHLLLIMVYERWHFNDDYLGISLLFAGIALAAWICGRVLHYLLRIKISKNEESI